MIKHIKKTAVGLAALIALALGGSALAQAGGTTAEPSPAPAADAQKSDATDRDNVQSGDQSGPEAPGAADEGDSAQEESESASETESEVAGDDGPGGHADEPADPDADHQNEGTE